MRTAFTDRSLRMRDGLQGRAVFTHEASSTADDWDAHKDCACPCDDILKTRPAGQPSYAVSCNRVTERVHCISNKADVHSANDSTFFAHGESDPAMRQDELVQSATWQRRKKVEARALSADSRQVAGDYRRWTFMTEGENGVVDRRHRAAAPLEIPSPRASVRDGVRLALSPRQGDPVPDSRITTCKKGAGQHKDIFSESSERAIVQWNQPIMRYEVRASKEQDAGLQRSRSLPPERRRNPVTMEGEAFQEKFLTFRDGRSNQSFKMSSVCDHEKAAREHSEERSARLKVDQRFADACSMTKEVAERNTKEVQRITAERRSNLSTGMADSLRWDS